MMKPRDNQLDDTDCGSARCQEAPVLHANRYNPSQVGRPQSSDQEVVVVPPLSLGEQHRSWFFQRNRSAEQHGEAPVEQVNSLGVSPWSAGRRRWWQTSGEQSLDQPWLIVVEENTAYMLQKRERKGSLEPAAHGPSCRPVSKPEKRGVSMQSEGHIKPGPQLSDDNNGAVAQAKVVRRPGVLGDVGPLQSPSRLRQGNLHELALGQVEQG